MPKHEPWTKEEAIEMGRKGGLAKAAKQKLEAAQTEEEKLQAAELLFKQEAPRMAAELIKAAKGHGDYKNLKPGEKLSAILRALEYGVGKPGTSPKQPPAPPTPEDEGGLVIE